MRFLRRRNFASEARAAGAVGTAAICYLSRRCALGASLIQMSTTAAAPAVPLVLPIDRRHLNEDNFSAAIAASLAETSYAVVDNFMSDITPFVRLMTKIGTSVRSELRAGDLELKSQFHKYSGSREAYISSHRSDLMRWVNPAKAERCTGLSDVLSQLDALVAALQHEPALIDEWTPGRSLRRHEIQVTCFPGDGSHFARHVDNGSEPITACARIHGRKGRRLTAIVYANDHWQPKDGGALRLYPDGGEVVDVQPLANRMCIFFSDCRTPHEVMPTFADRYALSLWYEDCPSASRCEVPMLAGREVETIR